MQSPEEVSQRAQMRIYWERHALLTFIVLIAAASLSAFARPIAWQLALGATAGGVLVYLSDVAAEKGSGLLSLSLITCGFVIAAWSMAVFGVLRGPLLWVQGLALFGAATCGCVAVAKSARAYRNKDSRA
jgi:hypothetical protein